ncbi:MAG: lipopolysaccharide biosynthesis protein [Streptosporangiaceae bacterium]
MRRLRLGAGDSGTLFGRASRALGWSFLSTALSRFGLLGFGILLARLLGPHQFGAAAVGFVALIAGLSFNDLGVSLAIVRWPKEPDEIVPTVLTITVVSSLLLYVGLFFSAPAFSAALGAPAATSVVRLIDVGVMIDGVVGVPAALLQRYFRQDRKLIADQVHSWLSAVVSVSLALAGFGAMSIAIGSVAGTLAGGSLIVRFSPLRLRFGFSISKARELLRFGIPLAGSSLIVFFIANVDNLVVGHVLGATALGFYTLAWNLASWPVTMFSQPVRAVAPALFSRLQQDPAALRKGFVSAAGLLGSITLPVCLLIAGSAVPLVGFLYGDRWLPASAALAWLALLGALRVFFELSYDFFVVLARSRLVLMIQIAWLLVLVPGLVAGARLSGIRGVAIAGLAAAGLVVLPWYLIELSRVGIRIRSLASVLWLPLAVAAGVGGIALAAAAVIPGDFAECAAAGIVAAVAIGLLGLRVRPVIREFREVIASNDEKPGELARSAPAKGPRHARTSSSSATEAAGHGAEQTADPDAQAAGLRALLALAVTEPPADLEMTTPLPVYRNAIRYPANGVPGGWASRSRQPGADHRK